MIRSSLTPCVAGFVSAILIAALVWPIEAQDADPLQFVPSSAVAAATLSPKALLAQPGMELVPYEVISAAGRQQFGFDPIKLERVVAVIDEFDSFEEPPGYGLVLQFDSPQPLSEQLLAHTEEDTLGGKTFYRSLEPHAPCFLLVADDLILIGSELFIRKMVDAKQAGSQLQRLIQTHDGGADGVGVFLAVDPIRPVIEQALDQAGGLPPPLTRFAQIPSLTRSVAVTAQFGEANETEIEIRARGETQAAELAEILVEGMDIGRQMILAEMQNEMARDDDVVSRAMVQYLNRVTGSIQQQLTPVREGERLVVSADGTSSVVTVGVMAALLLPAVRQAREAAQRVEASNQLRQFALAMHIYHDVHNRLPAGANYDENGRPLLSWRVHILPFIEERALYEQFKLDEPWDSPHNLPLAERMPAIYRTANADLDNKTLFLAITGPGTLFDGRQGRQLQDIRDGTSNTIMIVEADPSEAVVWTKPADWELDPERPWRGLGGLRPAGLNAAFADGSVQILSGDLPAETLRALMTIAGGEIVDRE